MNIGIIGGGIIGLTTGVVLAEAGHKVHIFSRDSFNCTTSFAAAAVTYPGAAEDTPRVNHWFVENLRILKNIMPDPEAGIAPIDWRKYSKAETFVPPSWLNMVEGARVLSTDECPSLYKSGIVAPLMIMNVDTYVPYLTRRFEKANGIYKIRNIENLMALAGSHDLLVNATGVFARHLVGDEEVEPQRGQVVVVKNPGLHTHFSIFEAKNYIYTRGDQCVLGGSLERGNWSMEANPALTEEILAWAASQDERLKNPEILSVRVGLRPYRPTVRIEKENLPNGTPLIHNYGHGGCGYTLSWPCAQEVLKLLL